LDRVRRVHADRAGRAAPRAHIRGLAAARRSTVTAFVAEHTRRGPDVPARAEAIRAAAESWAEFWQGRLALEALA
jgi:hypothetical protein